MNKQKGLSLIELMIAITLGLVLMTGVIQVFLSSKTVYSTQQALSRVQETGRLAIEFLSRDIRMAGYMGCASRAAGMVITNTLNNPSKYQFDFNTALMGYTADKLPLDHGLSPLPLANTDLFVVRGAFGSGAHVVQNNNGAQINVVATTPEPNACTDSDGKVSARISGICIGDILVVTDCTKARVFQATNLQETGSDLNVVHAESGIPGNSDASWGGSSDPESERFRNGAEVLSATTITYFVGTGTSGRPSLWQNVNGVNLELLEGVDDMSINYGVDSDGDYVPDGSYRDATKLALTDWNKVVALRVELLVASIEDGVLPETQNYSFGGVDNIVPDPVDRRLRQVFTTTVGIRSRSF